MVKADSGKLGYVAEEIRREVAEEVGTLLKKYFSESLADLARDIDVARVEYEGALAEYRAACETLLDEAKRRGVDLRKPAAAKPKAAKCATGPKVPPQRPISASMGSTAVGAHTQLDLSGTANTTTKDVKLHAYGTVN